jgi:hypothetical protein
MKEQNILAAPHVTGAIALLLPFPSKCDINEDGVYTSEEIIKRIRSTATDLGNEGYDTK